MGHWGLSVEVYLYFVTFLKKILHSKKKFIFLQISADRVSYLY